MCFLKIGVPNAHLDLGQAGSIGWVKSAVCALSVPMGSHTRVLENAQHCGVSLTEYMQNIEQLRAYDCHQNVTKPQATENHMKYTCDK